VPAPHSTDPATDPAGQPDLSGPRDLSDVGVGSLGTPVGVPRPAAPPDDRDAAIPYASYDYALIRVVPRVERDEFLNAGVILHCRTRRYLGARVRLDPRRLAVLAPDLDPDEAERHLALIPRICAGGRHGGPIGQLTVAERFHWLVAPRSTVVQTSPVHCGLCHDPAATLDHLFATLIQAGPHVY